MVDRFNESGAIVIEAIGESVIETPIAKFLQRSHDINGNPMVVVGRLNKPYQPLIPKAIYYAKQQLGKPYNASFKPNNDNTFYCSELIYKAFSYANNNQPIFKLNIMSFKDIKTNQTTKAWKQYFAEIKDTPPEGQIGTNPGMMSRESNISIVYYYGKLRTHR